MQQDRIMSADSHVVEPPDLFTTRIDRKYRDQAPRTVWGPLKDGREGEFYTWPGAAEAEWLPLSSLYAAGMGSNVAEMMEVNKSGFAGAPAYVREPAARLKAQDQDGVCAEVLYPSWGMFIFSVEDPELRGACFRAYNDWVAEFCSYDTKRLVGAGAIDLGLPQSVPAAVTELRRCAAKGLRLAVLPNTPAEGYHYGMEEYNPFWAAAEELGIPVSLHIHCDRKRFVFANNTVAPVGQLSHYIHDVPMVLMKSTSSIILGGVFDRFPKVKFVVAEADSSWAAHYLFRADHFYFSGYDEVLPLKMKPSDYFKQSVYTTFQWEGEKNVAAALEFVSADHIMWANDFPHFDSTYLSSGKVRAEALRGATSETDRKLIIGGAMATLYGL
jgi:predicted TIM-barrel fold metal-dependent hydrolase